MEITQNEFSTDIKLAEGETLEGYGDIPECTISMDTELFEEEIETEWTILKKPKLLGESALLITVAKEENQ